MAAMAGLGVLLDTTKTPAAAPAKEKQQQQQLVQVQPSSHVAAAQVVSKGAFLNAGASCSRHQPPPVAAPARCAFLQRCFRCHGELADGKDIYIYRGDMAFCSEDCRCRHILVETEADDGGATNCATAGRRSRRRQAVAGGFAF
ncbi:hypothetical protein ACP4OV_002263 [Aristida adscensionis]